MISVSLISVPSVSAHWKLIREEKAGYISTENIYLRFLKRKGHEVKARGLHSARLWIKTSGKLVSESSKCATKVHLLFSASDSWPDFLKRARSVVRGVSINLLAKGSNLTEIVNFNPPPLPSPSPSPPYFQSRY